MDVYRYMGAAEREEMTREQLEERLEAQTALIAELVEALTPCIRALGDLTEGEGLDELDHRAISQTLYAARATLAKAKAAT